MFGRIRYAVIVVAVAIVIFELSDRYQHVTTGDTMTNAIFAVVFFAVLAAIGAVAVAARMPIRPDHPIGAALGLAAVAVAAWLAASAAGGGFLHW